MHNALVGLAYIAMVLSPCVVAQWGHLLKFKYFRRLFMISAERAALRLEDARLDREYYEGEFAGPFFATLPPLPFGMEGALESARSQQRVAASQTPAFVAGQQRVALRLAQLAQANKVSSLPRPATVFAEAVAPLVLESVDLRVRKLAQPSEIPYSPPAPILAGTDEGARGAPPTGAPFLHSFSATFAGMTWDGTWDPTLHSEPVSHVRDVASADTAPQTAQPVRENSDLSEAA